MTAYLDEHLDDPDAADVAGGIPDPVLAEIGAERTGAMREIVATIQAEQDLVIRAPIDQVLVVQGGPGHRQDGGRPAPRRLPAVRAPPPAGPRRRARDRPEPGVPRLRRQRPAVARRAQRAPVHGARPVRAEGRHHRRRRPGRGPGQGRRRRCSTSCSSPRCSTVTPPADDVVVPIGARRVVFTRDEIAEWLDRAADGVVPFNQRRQRLRADRPAGAAPPHRPRRRLAAGRPAAQGARRGVADAAADQARRPAAARAPRPAPGVDGRRPAARRRGQLDPQRPAPRLRPRRRRRGPGPLGRRPAGHRPAQPGQLDDARRRRRPVDHAGRPGALGRRLRLPVEWLRAVGDKAVGDDRRADDRLPRPGADPHRRQPPPAADRRRRQRQPQRPRRGPRAGWTHTSPAGAAGGGGRRWPPP